MHQVDQEAIKLVQEALKEQVAEYMLLGKAIAPIVSEALAIAEDYKEPFEKITKFFENHITSSVLNAYKASLTASENQPEVALELTKLIVNKNKDLAQSIQTSIKEAQAQQLMKQKG